MSKTLQFDIQPRHWSGPPQSPPNPAYPKGIDVREAAPGVASCRADLPYPVPEQLFWSICCRQCGRTLMVTVAGRADDPRSVPIPCGEKLQ
jgi:hypothetical protein